MAGEADRIGNPVERAPDRLQKFLGIGFERGTRLVEHRPVPLVHDLDSQAFGGDVHQQLVLELPEIGTRLDDRLELSLQVDQSRALLALKGLLRIVELRGSSLAEILLLVPALRRIEIDALVAFDVATLDLAHRSGEVFTAALDDARTVATARTALHRHLERILEKLGNALQIALGGRAQQPHQQEEGHHRGHEVGIGDFPGAAMGPAATFLDPFDDNRLLGIVAHALVDPSHIRLLSLAIKPCGSSRPLPVPGRLGALSS